ncbi:MAG: protein kinase, partial [Synergistaceae bacterium]|nr:protein kinase [Synergistaceae bacterium]
MFNSGSQTIREDENATLRENRDGSATIREGQSAAGTGSVGGSFRDYRIVRQLPSTSTEADIFVIEKDGAEYILKLYRYGIEPKNDILQSIKALSEAHPQNFIRVYEADFDKGSSRWFEVQEYAKAGTLQAVLDDRSKLTAAQQSTLFNDVARQVGESLNLLHQNNLLHLDIKPSNILLRSLDPLDMVLIDFGIATSLASDMSKKFTQTRGTPMYQSPESYTGGMGRPSDWWGLGMILLEIAAGAHPFKGLSANVIAYSVATEPVNIPDNLDEGQKELFHGLLTRNPEKRWNWEQVSRWLNGERGIPQYFEETAAEGVSNKNPFVFMNQKYQTLAEIAAAFAKDEESWNKGKEFLMRGYVRQWMEGNQEFDASLELDNFLGSVQDTDEKTFRFIQKYGQNIPFIFCGKAITLQNLLLFTGKAVNRLYLTAEEKKIVDMVGDGRLLDCLSFCQQPGKDAAALRMALEIFKGKSVADVAGLLNFYLNPTKYYCPFVKDTSSPEKVIAASRGLNQPPRPIEDWNKLNDKYILPRDRVDSLSNVSSYHAAFSQLEAMAANGLQLIPRASNT